MKKILKFTLQQRRFLIWLLGVSIIIVFIITLPNLIFSCFDYYARNNSYNIEKIEDIYKFELNLKQKIYGAYEPELIKTLDNLIFTSLYAKESINDAKDYILYRNEIIIVNQLNKGLIDYNTLIRIYMIQGDYKNAKQAVLEYSNYYNTNIPILADFYLNIGQFDKAKKIYDKNIISMTKDNNYSPNDYSEIETKLALIYKAQNTYTEAEKHYKLILETKNLTNYIYVKALNSLGDLYLENSDYKNAELNFKKALYQLNVYSIGKNKNGKSSEKETTQKLELLFITYTNYGNLCTNRKQYEKAKDYFNKAELILKNNNINNYPFLNGYKSPHDYYRDIYFFDKKAKLYESIKDFKQSFYYYKKSLNIEHNYYQSIEPCSLLNTANLYKLQNNVYKYNYYTNSATNLRLKQLNFIKQNTNTNTKQFCNNALSDFN